MATLRTHHVGITVSDLDAAVPFYRDVLGLTVVDRFEVSGAAFETAVGVDGARGRFAHLTADGEDSVVDGDDVPVGGTRLELVEYEPGARACTADRIDQRGAKHVGFAVPDLGTFFEELPDDVETLSGPRTTASGTTILFLRDPEGNLVEILEA